MNLARSLRNFGDRVRYSGDAVSCNVCGYTGRSWLNGQAYGRCPACRCPTRSRVLRWYIGSGRAPIQPGARVLHFAPEPPLRASLQRWSTGEYKTCDLRRRDVDIQADITAMPMADGSFDLVICCHVLEHIRDDRAAMRELRRICSSDGHVLVQVPQHPTGPTTEDLSDIPADERKRRFGEVDHMRKYGTDIRERLRDAGFDVEMISVAETVDSATRERLGLGDQRLFVCRARVD